MRRAAAAFGAALWLAALPASAPSSAFAQGRGPDEQKALVELARVLGESHALRQACVSDQDQTWRDRMQALLSVEAPGADLKTRLAEAFNSGFGAGRTGFPACGTASRAEAARIAARGETLATRLGSP